MTTIAPFAAGSYTATRNAQQLTSLKSQLNDLTTQLGSGLTAQTYGGLGTGRTAALSAQASVSALTGYAAVIGTAQTRAKLATTSLTQVATVASDANATLQNGLQSTPVDSQAAKSTALNNLNAALDALNQTDGSVYLFGGRDGTTSPVLDATTILNGTTDANGNTLDGLSTLVSQQVTADLGPNGDGRVTTTASGTTVSLAEGASARVGMPKGSFGFSLNGISTSNTNAFAVTQTSTTSPMSYSVGVAAQPTAGDTVTVKLGLPDGTSTTVTLTAASYSDPSSSSTFAIGTDQAATAANLSSALGNALKTAAAGPLTANATARASTNFFSASDAAGTVPQRITTTNGVPSYTAGTKTNTVVWYRGTDSGTSSAARASQTFQIGSSASVQLGAQANEAPIRSVLAGLATVALGMPAATTGTEAYEAVVAQATPLLNAANTSPSVQDIVTDFSLASARMTTAASTNTAQQSAFQDTVDGIEQPSTEEVATKLLDLQNRLQASYQITSSLSKLSLVNYLS
jgi:hypothetical protein